jgi:formate hydrogenlyase subunit 3/multisubunit Na+/H+ antiporter MnhD subunit
MVLQHYFVLSAIFVLLLTIILFGIGRVVIKMAFGTVSEDKAKIIEENKHKVSIFMYVPQFIMLIIVFVLGIYIPPFLHNIISLTIAGF